MISVLNNVSSLVAENALSSTQTSLQNTLQQLSTGLRINSGSNDPAGLSIANGLGANIAALTQSSQNASNGVGLLQTADGALSQVTSLLNQAVSIATEAANGGLTTSQATAANTQFTSIMSEINQIGQTTNFNGSNVFSGNAAVTAATATSGTAVASTAAVVSGLTITLGSGAVATYTVGTTATAAQLATDIGTLGAGSAGTTGGAAGSWTISGTVNGVAATAADFAGLSSSTPTATAADLSISTSTTSAQASYGQSVTVGGTTTGLGTFTSTSFVPLADTVYTSDGTAGGSASLGTTISALSSTALGLTGNLSKPTGAQAALLQITNAISTVAAQRGTIGANVNQLTATEGVQNTEVQNLTSAQNNIQNADIGTTVAKMTQYNVLEQTGMAAMSQSNQAQQAVLKLLQ